MRSQSAILLAAGKGTRMKSDRPKVLCEVLFRPMVCWAADACREAGIESVCAVIGYGGDQVQEVLGQSVRYAVQEQQRGTGHAVMCAKAFLEERRDGDVLVLNGDAPFLDAATIRDAYALHRRERNAVTVITASLPDPTGYGRIVRDGDGIAGIVEEKDASAAERAIREVNSGAYWFSTPELLDVLFRIRSANAQGEYYLTDTVALLLQAGCRAGAFRAENPDIVLGANSRSQLLSLNRIANRRVAERLMEEGVEFLSLDGVLLSPDCRVGRGTRILPGTILREGAVIGEDCVIGPNSLVSRTTIGDRTVFNASQCYQSAIGSDVSIGPFCHIRPNSRIRDGVHIGDFVEVKNSDIGESTHISHLTYVGDSDVGRKVNFGCGVATANYNGISKARCRIGDNAFIGCNTNLVAPVTVGANGYTAAGSTITDDVPDDAMGIARARQVNKAGYNRKIRGTQPPKP